MNIAEKIETIILYRVSGEFGEYLGSGNTVFGSCYVDGNVYHIKRNNETISDDRWMVFNVTQNLVAYTDSSELAYANKFNSMNSELRQKWNNFGVPI